MDLPAPPETAPESPGTILLSDPQVVEQLRTWRSTGHAPFPELGPPSRAYWEQFSVIDQRLLHHIASLTYDIHNSGHSRFCIWSPRMPIFLSLARSCDFVMSAVLAFSASHIAWLTGNAETLNLAYQHRGVALKGLHETIGSFNRANSEAILAASIVLSWQATEWRSWASLQQGVSTVLDAMRPWLHETELGTFLQEQRQSRGARTPVIPSIPSPHQQRIEEDLSRLDEAITQIRHMRQSVQSNEDMVSRLTDLVDFLQELRADFPVPAPEQAFERLQTLRMWLFWLPPILLRQDDSDIGAIAVLSHFFSSALLVEPLFPEIGGSYFGSMVTGPIDEMRTTLLTKQAAEPQSTAIHVALSLTEFPQRTLMNYRMRQQSLSQHQDLQPQGHRVQLSPPPSTLRSTYLPSENIATYRDDTISSTPPSVVLPIPSPYPHFGSLSRPDSYASQSSQVSLSSTFETPSSSADPTYFSPLPSQGGDHWRSMLPEDPLPLSSPFLDTPHQFIMRASSPHELWI